MSNNKQQQTIKRLENSLVEISKFEVKGGVTEYHVMIHATHPEQTYQEQQDAVLNTYYNLLEEDLKGAIAVFKRYFLSDAANQVNTLLATVPESATCGCSVIQQPPLNGTKIALWVYLQTEMDPSTLATGLFEASHIG